MSKHIRKILVLGPRGTMTPGSSQDPTSQAGALTLPDAVATDSPWIKLWADWPTIQPTSSSGYNFAALDNQIAGIRQISPGLTGRAIILGLTHKYPKWANGNATDQTPPTNRTSSGPWASLVWTLLTRYSFQNPYRPSYYAYIDALELFNEPNLLMPGSQAQIAEVVAQMMLTAHTVQQNAGIHVGWPALMAPAVSDERSLKSFTEELLGRLNGAGYDASNTWWTIHNYADVRAGTTSAPSQTISALKAAGWNGLGMSASPPHPIWITESGSRLSEAGSSGAQGARVQTSLSNLTNDNGGQGYGVAATSNYLDISAPGQYSDTGLRNVDLSQGGPYSPWKNTPSIPGPPPPPSPFSWSVWESLGGQLIAPPGISSLGPSHLDVFVTGTTHQVFHNWYDIRVGWSGFSAVPGSIATNESPASASWSANRVDLFVRGTDDALWHTFYENGAWVGNWESLGGTLTSAPAASIRGFGTLDVFVRGSDNGLYHIFYQQNYGWQPYEALGGILTGAPACVSWSANRLDVFAPGVDHSLYHKWYINGVGWSSWESLGGVLATGTAPCVSTLGEGKLDVFVVGVENALYHRWYSESTGWSSWESLGGALFGRPGSVSWSPTRVDVVGQGTDNALYHKFWGQ